MNFMQTEEILAGGAFGHQQSTGQVKTQEKQLGKHQGLNGAEHRATV